MRVFEIQSGFGLEHLKQTDRPTPKPGPGQALIQIRACSLNYRDWLMVTGSYNPKQALPLIPLSDGVGKVLEIGDGVTRVKPGDRVAGIFAQKWLNGELSPEARASTLGGPLDGMLAEQVVLCQDGLVHVPEHLTDEQAATLPCAAVTAWNALMQQAEIKPGDSVLLLGTGGVSVFGLQLGKLAGAKVIITSSSEHKLQKALELGASAGINHQTEAHWDKQVRKLTQGRGVDLVLEVGGANTLPKSIQAVRFGGTIALIGILGGVSTDLMLTSILMKQVRIQGVLVGHRNMFEQMNRALSQNKLKPVVDRVFPFEQAPEAFSYLNSGKHFGKIVIRF